jgi:hypothetical protein
MGVFMMRNVVALVLAIFAASLPFSSISHCQEADSLLLESVSILPGDTASLTLNLINESFSVGGFSVKLGLEESSGARFLDIQRGFNVVDFAIFETPINDGAARINAFANWPEFDPVSPLPPGVHQLATIRVVVDDTVSEGSQIIVSFDRSGEAINVISDSTGYESVEPFTLDGVITVGELTDIDYGYNRPLDFELKANYPNPFNASTTIGFDLSSSGQVLLEIYDVLGQRVATLFDNYATPGSYSVVWNGRADNNQPLASGLYIYRLSLNGTTSTKKMSLIK